MFIFFSSSVNELTKLIYADICEKQCIKDNKHKNIHGIRNQIFFKADLISIFRLNITPPIKLLKTMAQ